MDDHMKEITGTMSRDSQRKKALLNRFYAQKSAKERSFKAAAGSKKRPRDEVEGDDDEARSGMSASVASEPSQCRSPVDAQKRIQAIVREITKIMGRLIRATAPKTEDEKFAVREMNDQLNDLLRLKGKWDRRLATLNGSMTTTSTTTAAIALMSADSSDKRFFGAAKLLPEGRASSSSVARGGAADDAATAGPGYLSVDALMMGGGMAAGSSGSGGKAAGGAGGSGMSLQDLINGTEVGGSTSSQVPSPHQHQQQAAKGQPPTDPSAGLDRDDLALLAAQQRQLLKAPGHGVSTTRPASKPFTTSHASTSDAGGVGGRSSAADLMMQAIRRGAAASPKDFATYLLQPPENRPRQYFDSIVEGKTSSGGSEESKEEGASATVFRIGQGTATRAAVEGWLLDARRSLLMARVQSRVK